MIMLPLNESRAETLTNGQASAGFHNTTRKQEIFIPHVTASVVLLSSHSLHGISTHVSIAPRHPGGKPAARADGYWPAYITRAGKGTAMEVTVEIRAADSDSASADDATLSHLKAARLDVHYPAYGPHGSLPLVQHVILPLAFPACPPPSAPHAPQWHSIAPGISVLAVPTHLLCHLDDPLLVLRRYAAPYLQPGDVVTIGETPLAIMQGRFRHPDSVRAGPVARWACRRFLPTSSLATACGMQVRVGVALIDVVGVVRVVVAVLLAALARVLLRQRVHHPLRPQETVEGLSAKLGCGVAIVDVNDLKKVQILAASAGVDHGRLTTALLPNPAGELLPCPHSQFVRGSVRCGRECCDAGARLS
ncbi:unnamed protein product [Closterium sp. Naga37s-1]|nr:unnamed protein product [Closterium sp. Naga37s-1]